MSLYWKKTDLPTLQEKKADEVRAACEAEIYAGIDVELSGGTQHFSLTANDQTNIDSMFAAVTLGATEYPYHADGEACAMYSAADIIALYVAYKTFVTAQTTYHNGLKQWIERETDYAVLGAIHYGSTLPDDLAANMQSVLQQAQAQIEAIVAKLQQSA